MASNSKMASKPSEGNPRKRLRISKDESRPSPPAGTALMSRMDEVNQAPTQSHVAHEGSCQHEAVLKSMNSDISAMRDLVTCQVCHKLMYEPYALSCGHTYCYTCLSQWLSSSRKKSCPDCRANITQQPTPSYIIRELVLIFVGRSQLLPDGETSEEHHTMAREEAELVAKDKANEDPRTGGLFKGVFSRRRHLFHPMYDPGDNVNRCPDCHWEVEDGYCVHCDHGVGDDSPGSDSDSEDSELDHDALLGIGGEAGFDTDEHDAVFGGRFTDGFSADEDDNDGIDGVDPAVFAAAFGDRPPGFIMPGGGRPRDDGPNVWSSDASEDEDEQDSEMDDFIDDDEDPERSGEPTYGSDDSDDTEIHEEASRPYQRREPSPVVISDDERPIARRAGLAHVIPDDDDDDEEEEDSDVSDDDDDEDDDDDDPVIAHTRGYGQTGMVHRRHPTAIDSEDESSEDESDEERDLQPSDFPPTGPTGSQLAAMYPSDTDARSLPSTRYDSEAPSSGVDATLADYGIYNMDGTEESDDDNESDTRASAPSMQDRRNRLRTGMQHRSRHTHGPALTTRPSRRPESPLAGRHLRPAGSLPQLHDPGRMLPPGSHYRPSAHVPLQQAHPFDLGNTLHRINNTYYTNNDNDDLDILIPFYAPDGRGPYRPGFDIHARNPAATPPAHRSEGTGGVPLRLTNSAGGRGSSSTTVSGTTHSHYNQNGKRTRGSAARDGRDGGASALGRHR